MSNDDDFRLQLLSQKLSSLSTDDEKVSAALDFLEQTAASQGPVGLGTIFSGNYGPPVPSNPPPLYLDEHNAFDILLEQHNIVDAFLASYRKRLDSGSKLPGARDHAFDRMPCAHVVVGSGWACPNTSLATMSVCSNCRLVAYCSTECQKAHWKLKPYGHKRDCKDRVLAETWQPAWVEEKRSPSFINESNAEIWTKGLHPLALGKALWGNVPAVDVVNLSKNEADSGVNLSIGFAASGDLRNVVKTVNSLPTDYHGELTVLLNDHDPYVVLRNFALLHLLGSVVDQRRAADVALHFWYSAFMPHDYVLHVSSSFASLAQGKGDFDLSLGGGASSLSGRVSADTLLLMARMQTSVYTVEDVNNEINRVRFSEARVDLHHRLYCRLEPSHRLSYLDFRRFGLALPFGAQNAWFNSPNRSLFSPEGRYMQGDLANPLDSWDPVAVVEAGRHHGAPCADLYGCLYFYLSDQLREFHARLARFHIKFKMFDLDTVALSGAIRSGSLSKFGLPPSTRFDRIDVSNVVDVEYVGLRGVVKAWGGLMRDSPHATLLAYFMNWAAGNNDAQPGKDAMRQLTTRMVTEGKLPLKTILAQKKDTVLAFVTAYHETSAALFDNSPAFAVFLSSLRIQPVLDDMGLKLKEEHTISPHRYYAPLGAPPSALPVFPDAETWYLRTNIGAPLWSERYVEICRA